VNTVKMMAGKDRNMQGLYHALFVIVSDYSAVVVLYMLTYRTARNRDNLKNGCFA